MVTSSLSEKFSSMTNNQTKNIWTALSSTPMSFGVYCAGDSMTLDFGYFGFFCRNAPYLSHKGTEEHILTL